MQTLIGIKCFTEYGLSTAGGELLFFVISPTNISVLSSDSVESKVRKLTLALSAAPDLEIACVDSAERFDDIIRHNVSAFRKVGMFAPRENL